MKRFLAHTLACAALVNLMCLTASADVEVTLKMEHVEYLQYEKMTAFITIFNDEDYDIVIDGTRTNRTDGLRFSINYDMKTPAVKINRLPIIDYLELKPGEKKTMMVDLTMWYSLSKVGSYDVVAQLEYAGRKWTSKRFLVDVVDGIETASLTRSLPGDPNRSRTYSLRYWSREQKEYLFLRAEEKEADLVYGVFLLGGLIRIVKPVLEVDRKGNVTVIHQSGREVFTKTTFLSEPYSVKFVDQVYLNQDGVPYKMKER